MINCILPTRIKSSVSSFFETSLTTIPVILGVNTPETEVEKFIIILLNELPTLYTATAELLASIPKITLSVDQNSISTIEPIKINVEKPINSFISFLGNNEKRGLKCRLLKQ